MFICTYVYTYTHSLSRYGDGRVTNDSSADLNQRRVVSRYSFGAIIPHTHAHERTHTSTYTLTIKIRRWARHKRQQRRPPPKETHVTVLFWRDHSVPQMPRCVHNTHTIFSCCTHLLLPAPVFFSRSKVLASVVWRVYKLFRAATAVLHQLYQQHTHHCFVSQPLLAPSPYCIWKGWVLSSVVYTYMFWRSCVFGFVVFERVLFYILLFIYTYSKGVMFLILLFTFSFWFVFWRGYF